jgi:hypothetical protein
MAPAMRTTTAAALLVQLLAAACSRGGPRGATDARPLARVDAAATADAARPPSAASCPATAPAPDPLPGVRPEHLSAAYWIDAAGRDADPDAEVLTRDQILRYADLLARGRDGRPGGRSDLLAPPDPRRSALEIRERLGQIDERFRAGEFVERDGGRAAPGSLGWLFAPLSLPAPSPELRVALAPIALHCGPRVEPYYTDPPDPAFDRNLCSTIRPQEPVLVVMNWADGIRFARTPYTIGFIGPDAELSPPVPPDLREAFVRGPRVEVVADLALEAEDGSAGTNVAAGTFLPATGEAGRVRFASARGLHVARPVDPAALQPTDRPLTRRAFLDEAFRRLGTPYGWGDANGGIDCSRLVLDVFESFGIGLPRNSAAQAEAAPFSLAVAPGTSLEERLRLIDAAARRGIVLLQFPGHIMLYLGRDAAGVPLALHSTAEYLRPCPGDGGETKMIVNRVVVSTLDLGRGSSKGSHLERVSRIAVFEPEPAPAAGPEEVVTP